MDFGSIVLAARKPEIAVAKLLDLPVRWADNARRFVEGSLRTLALLVLVACCTTPVLLRSLLAAVSADPARFGLTG